MIANFLPKKGEISFLGCLVNTKMLEVAQKPPMANLIFYNELTPIEYAPMGLKRILCICKGWNET